MTSDRFIVREWDDGFYIVDTDPEGQMPVGPYVTRYVAEMVRDTAESKARMLTGDEEGAS